MRGVSKILCSCCGYPMGEFENGKVLVVRKNAKLAKRADYIAICGDCLANADDDTDEELQSLEQEEFTTVA